MKKNLSPEEIALSDSLVDELVGAVGLPKTKFTHKLFRFLARGATDRMAALGVPFNRIIGEEGFPAGCGWGASNFCNPPQVAGGENIPLSGPVLVTCNHPGAYDGLIVISRLIRKDIKLILTEIPFFQLLPNACEHMLFTSHTDKRNRMLVMRSAISHLKAGGAVVYIGAGHREPDPAVYSGADESIKSWLDIYDAFFKYVPGLNVMPAIMSGMITEHWARHPFVKIRRRQRDQQRLAEFCQVISQLMHPGKLMVTPNLSFGKAFSEAQIKDDTEGGTTLDAVIARTRALLSDHCGRFHCVGTDG